MMAMKEQLQALMLEQDCNDEENVDETLMAVKLLKHQRLALAWMLKCEKRDDFIKGGILADEQGLGKTITVLSLILKDSRKKEEPFEQLSRILALARATRKPRSKRGSKQISQPTGDCQEEKKSPLKNISGGTLIVCPTGILRQWASEINTKVTKKAGIRLLIYHGNKRKDWTQEDIAEHDIVLTTYSLIGQEVPEAPEPIMDSEGKLKKLKKRRRQHKKSTKFANGPLANIVWNRVILDEAHFIKNAKTKVARACQNLRGEKRWCLSGTPIQNQVDDLFSYFRFLYFSPLDEYTEFKKQILKPIRETPEIGYPKLHALLKAVLMRRTKDTKIDEQSIIELPKKVVTMERLELSLEELDFYSMLEQQAKAEYEEYKKQGTLKDNFFKLPSNMLKLRQACNHACLVNTSKKVKEDIDELLAIIGNARLPRAREREQLLQKLETSDKKCSICHDAPEDAVIGKCGHIYCKKCILTHLKDNEARVSDDSEQDGIKSIDAEDVQEKPVTRKRKRKSTCLEESWGDDDDDTECSNDMDYTVSEDEDLSDGESDMDYTISEDEDYSLSEEGESKKEQIIQHKCPHESCSRSLAEAVYTLAKLTRKKRRIDIGAQNEIGEQETLKSSTKINQALKILNDIERTRPGEKTLIFSQWTSMLDIVEPHLQRAGIKFTRLDGTMSLQAREKSIVSFTEDPDVRIMLISLKAGGIGLNLVAASNVIMLDMWWNPSTEAQAIDRVHRIGQQRPVEVFSLAVKNSVEDRIIQIQQKKRAIVSNVFEDGNGTCNKRLTLEDLELF